MDWLVFRSGCLTPDCIGCRGLLPAWGFMWTLAVAMYAGLKWLSWWKARHRIAHAAWRSVAYLLAWPGMDAEAFLDSSHHVSPPTYKRWYWAISKLHSVRFFCGRSRGLSAARNSCFEAGWACWD